MLAALAAAPGMALANRPALSVELMADFSEMQAQIGALRSLLLEAGNVPEALLQQLRGLVEGVGLVDEIEGWSLPAARRAHQLRIAFRFRSDGELDRIRTALRALVLEGNG